MIPSTRQRPGMKRKHLAALVIAISIAGYLAAIVLLPWQMDEYIMFHQLACWDPTQAINTFEYSCFKPELLIKLPIGISYYRSFAYGGITSSLIQSPFQHVWDSLWTNQLVGILFLALSALGIKKSFRLNTIGTLLIVIWFPIAYSLIHDGGPVRMSFLAASWSPYFVQRFLSAPHRFSKAITALSLVALWLFSAEDKPYFFYLMPGLTALIAASIQGEGRRLNKQIIIKVAALLTTTFLICTFLLLFANVNGVSYFHYLSTQVKLDKISTLPHSVRLLVDFPENAERIIESNRHTKLSSIISMITFAYASFLSWKLLKLKPQRTEDREIIWLLISLSILWFFGWVAGGRFHHHFVFAQIPVAIIFAKCLENGKTRKQLLLLTLLIGLSFFSAASVSISPKNNYYSSSAFVKILSNGVNSSSPGTIVNCSSWGCYYSHSLAGSNGLPVVWASDQSSLQSLAKLARSKKVDILHVCYKCDLAAIDRLYGSFTRSSSDTINGWLVARYQLPQ